MKNIERLLKNFLIAFFGVCWVLAFCNVTPFDMF